MTYTLVLLRHGQSEWNAKNVFAGWVDVDLSERGVWEARHCSELLRDAHVLPDVLHTSLLRRAIRTAEIVLDGVDRHWIGVKRSWRLNERHYGALQGKDKEAILEQFGKEQFMIWRRSYTTPPPPLSDDRGHADPRYAHVPAEVLPRTECLRDVIDRLRPYWYDQIAPDLLDGNTVLVTAHGSSLRALVMHLDGLTEDEIVGLEIPTGIPLVYELDDDLVPVTKGGRYLDLEVRESRRGYRA